MEDSSNHATLPILGNLSSDDTEDLIRLLVTSTISTDESEKTGLLVLLALRVSYIIDEDDGSENPVSGRQHPPTINPIIQTLAERAGGDHDLRALMRRVAQGTHIGNDLENFQGIIDEISKSLESASGGIGGNVDEDNQVAKKDSKVAKQAQFVDTNITPVPMDSNSADTNTAQVLDQPVPIAGGLPEKNTETLPKVAMMLVNAVSSLISENTRLKERLRAAEGARPMQAESVTPPGAELKSGISRSESESYSEEDDYEEEYEEDYESSSEGSVAVRSDGDERRDTPIIGRFNKVTCKNGGENYFLDPPRMFRGDRKLDHVRGQKGIDLTNYFDNHSNQVFAVVYLYNCTCGLGPTDHQVVGFRDGRLVDDSPIAACTGQMIFLRDSLRKTINDLITLHPARFEGLSSGLTNAWCRKPYYQFYLHNKTFLDLVHSDDLERERSRELELLCDWFEDHLRQDWEEADELFSRGKVNLKHCTKLFRPSELVLHPRENDPGLAKVYKTDDYPWRYAYDRTVDIIEWEFNGSFRKIKIWIDPGIQLIHLGLEDEVDITSLPYYPFRFADPDIRKKLTARGHKFWSCRKPKLVAYITDPGLEQEDRLMVDYNIFKSLHSTKSIFQNTADDLGKAAMDKDEPPDEDFLTMMPPKIHAFDFTTKSWKLIRVDRITSVTWNKDAFKRLVIPPETRELIQAAVTVHGQYLTTARDIIASKGRGLLILLHGGPGTGKTLTAESIAETQERPLYRVTCGDIGLEPAEAEQYLQSVLTIGKAWSCVVLLDEADVFLEERNVNDQRQNVFVSVFLRALEYYDGILILTTNRVGTFDEAFKSRIHLALLYPNLDEEQRAEIWRNFIHMLSRTKELVDIEDLELNIHKLAQIDINGRQIRNIFTLARYLAKFRKQVLVYNHVRDAVASVTRFDKYLETVRGSDDSWARESRLR